MKTAAKTITQRKEFPCSEPILEATVILPGPKTTEAMIKPGPNDFRNSFIRIKMKSFYALKSNIRFINRNNYIAKNQFPAVIISFLFYIHSILDKIYFHIFIYLYIYRPKNRKLL